MSAQLWRLAHASAVLVLGILAVPAVQHVADAGRSAFDKAAFGAQAQELAQQAVRDPQCSGQDLPSPFELFERLTGNGVEAAGVPQAFATEVLSEGDLPHASFSAAAGVVGGTCRGDLDSVRQLVDVLLEEKGWVRLGATNIGSTYLKREGSLRWMHVFLAQSGEHVSFVFTYLEGGGA